MGRAGERQGCGWHLGSAAAVFPRRPCPHVFAESSPLPRYPVPGPAARCSPGPIQSNHIAIAPAEGLPPPTLQAINDHVTHRQTSSPQPSVLLCPWQGRMLSFHRDFLSPSPSPPRILLTALPPFWH
ncbi:hypothetical protein AAFF_G00358930 [Aldrovandia affinis]|uniref:Uncharacterized protein n=1 Tax=Aldrovandia affinis TaxID=143900 RepID=A0AAD7SI22_9TELE|nr:hypothetical protein AAFF_G00358930 [Aldrovandia affinis]